MPATRHTGRACNHPSDRDSIAADRPIIICFATTMFGSAALLFAVQPLAGRLILPRLGGSPAVWNTSLVFFQTVLLAGYAYSFFLTRWLTIRVQTVVQVAVVGLAMLALPVALPAWTPPVEASPVPWLLGILTVGVGAPFFALATSAPLLQRWFAATRHARASDPYFLYAWSNAGSLSALVAYPLLIEPAIGLSATARYWSIAFGAFVAMTVLAALIVWRRPRLTTASLARETGRRADQHVPRLDEDSRSDVRAAGKASVSERRRAHDSRFVPEKLAERLWWLALSAVPTSWMLAVTMHLTTDLAPVPLLWTLPLALYLVTYIVAFGSWGPRVFPVAARLFAPAMILLAGSLLFFGRWQLLAIDLAAFFVGALACHGELARRRPAVPRLAEYYFWISLGGALGGAFNALAAPVVFPAVYEYPLTVGLACLFVPPPKASKGPWPNLIALAAAMAVVVMLQLGADVAWSPMTVGVLVGLAVLALLMWRGRTRWFAPVIAALLLGKQTSLGQSGEQIFLGRSFFGVLHVQADYERMIEDETGKRVAAPRYLRLLHGSIVHGLQSVDPARQCEPLGYYARSGPLGEIMTVLPPEGGRVDQVAVVGLGTGAAACYAGAERFVTFYEIDPLVLRLAETHFSYLDRCGAGHVRVVLGDGRRQLEMAPPGTYRLIVLDAFSSDAIPMHLLTREALAVYLDKLAPGGLIAYHVTNNYLDLAPVLAALAADAGLVGLVRRDLASPADERAGKFTSTYVVLARHAGELRPLAEIGLWQPLVRGEDDPAWTDDYADILGALKWDPTGAFTGP